MSTSQHAGDARRRDLPLPVPRPRLPGDTPSPRVCRAVWDEICVLANGDIVCSCGDPAGLRRYGNVHQDRISDVYNGPMYQEIRRWQLASRPESWCPVVGGACGGRIYDSRPEDRPDQRTPRMLQIEPVSVCNLRCPSCPVTHFRKDPNHYASDRENVLSLGVMLDVVEQLPDLERLLFYNFGEPFLHPGAVAFLREVRRMRPRAEIRISTNGLALTPAKIDAVASEALVDEIVFSIDGARQESYERYRVRGRLDRALASLASMRDALERYGTLEEVRLVWQYILFTWNDSSEELARARALADGIGCPIHFVLTHTPGASRRVTADSQAFRELVGGPFGEQHMSCELQLAEGLHRAGLRVDASHVEAEPGAGFTIGVFVENRSSGGWAHLGPGAIRLGFQLRTSVGRNLAQLPGVPLPEAVLEPSGWEWFLVELRAPSEPGEYELLVDLVHEGVCWFHEQGSSPGRLRLSVGGSAARRGAGGAAAVSGCHASQEASGTASCGSCG